MPLRLNVKKKLNTRTERVKCVDFHPTEPWVLSALYSGMVMIHQWETQSLVKSLEVSQLPIRCAKFITRRQWIVAAGDDMSLRVYNYNTSEKVRELEAHSDYIRYLAVHPSLPYVLTASDDMTVRLWDWEKDWQRIQIFEGHVHYVMMCQWNPKDPHIFATASLDRTIKVWGVSASSLISTGSSASTSTPHFVLNGHERGVNCIEYSLNGEKPYIVSGSDDKTVKVWDYQTKQCVATLTGHSRNVSAVVFHPRLPVIISGSEDGTIRLWHSSTYRLESTVSYHMDRAWATAIMKSSTAVAVGFDEGTLVLKLGSESPLASLQGGKIVWAKGHDLQTANLKFVDETLYSDGEKLPLAVKDLGACEIFPQQISHHPNGRLVAVCGDDEYVVYTAQALRSKAYGKAIEFQWSPEGHFAVRDESRIRIFHDFKEHTSIKPTFPVEAIFGGKLLGLLSSDFICFYDWQDAKLVRRVDVTPNNVWWNDACQLVCLACEGAFYILRYDKDAVSAGGADSDADGLEDAFELLHEVKEDISTASWVSESLVFVSQGLRLQSFIAGQIEPIAFLDRKMTILGYTHETDKFYLIDNDFNVVSYSLHLSLVEYLSAICRQDFEVAAEKFKVIPESLHDRVARFLEHQGHRLHALEIARDLDHQFELALSLGKLDRCASIIRSAEAGTAKDDHVVRQINSQRWKQLGDAALDGGQFDLAERSFHEAEDASGMMLLAVSTGNEALLRTAADCAAPAGKLNIAVLSYFLLNDVDKCLETLIDANRLPEAAFFARTYVPSKMSSVVKLWKQSVQTKNKALANALADPEENPECFSGHTDSLAAEGLARERMRLYGLPSSQSYQKNKELLEVNILDHIKDLGIDEVRRIFLAPSDAASVGRNSSAQVDGQREDFPTATTTATIATSPRAGGLSGTRQETSPSENEENQMDLLGGSFGDIDDDIDDAEVEAPFIGTDAHVYRAASIGSPAAAAPQIMNLPVSEDDDDEDPFKDVN